MAELNNDLLRLTPKDIFVTAFAGLYDAGRFTLTWSLAGHPPPLFMPREGETVGLEERSVFLGVFPNSNPLVKYVDHELEVNPGDRLALYTDGLTEAPDAQGGQYGQARLRRVLDQGRKQDVQQIRNNLWHDLSRFAQSELPDDVAFILVDFQ